MAISLPLDLEKTALRVGVGPPRPVPGVRKRESLPMGGHKASETGDSRLNAWSNPIASGENHLLYPPLGFFLPAYLGTRSRLVPLSRNTVVWVICQRRCPNAKQPRFFSLAESGQLLYIWAERRACISPQGLL